jgi:hypothetical protein
MELPGAKARAAHFADRAVRDYSVRAWLAVFLDHLTAAVTPRPIVAAAE